MPFTSDPSTVPETDEQKKFQSLLAEVSKVIYDVAQQATVLDGQSASDKLRQLLLAQHQPDKGLE